MNIRILSIALIGVIFISLISCDSSLSNNNGIESKGENEGEKENEDGVSASYENLGAGYDVFENYADITKIKAQILDLSKLKSDDMIETKILEKSEYTIHEGKSISEYAESLNTKTKISGNYKFFSASLEVNYSSSDFSKSELEFATVQSLIQKKKLQVKQDVTETTLKNYLSSSFYTAINDDSVAPEKIFQTYGTHCMRSIIVGGRLDYNVSVESKFVSEKSSIGVMAKASFENAFAGGSVENETNKTQEQSNFEQNIQKNLIVYGGASEYGQNIINESDYSDWINSINDNQVFCEFGENGLIPVWEFCENEERKKEIESGFDSWAQKKQFIDNVKSSSMVFGFDTTGEWNNTDGDAEMDVDKDDKIDVSASISFSIGDSKTLLVTCTFEIKEYKNDTEFGKDQTIVKSIKYNGPGELTGIACKTRYDLKANHIGTSEVDETGTFDEYQWSDLQIPKDEQPEVFGVKIPAYIKYAVDGKGNDDDSVGIWGNIRVPVYYSEGSE